MLKAPVATNCCIINRTEIYFISKAKKHTFHANHTNIQKNICLVIGRIMKHEQNVSARLCRPCARVGLLPETDN